MSIFRQNRRALITLLSCGLTLIPQIVRADEITRLSNASFALTVLDMLTTRESLVHTNGTENNPVARLFVKSDIGALGYAVLTTGIERLVFHTHPKAFYGVDAIEGYAVIHNYSSRLRALAITRDRENSPNVP